MRAEVRCAIIKRLTDHLGTFNISFRFTAVRGGRAAAVIVVKELWSEPCRRGVRLFPVRLNRYNGAMGFYRAIPVRESFRILLKSGGVPICFCLALSFAVLWAFPLSAQSFFPASSTGATVSFFSSLEDIPLMPGLAEIASEGLVFDKPEGRIVEALALTGTLGQKDVLIYYGGTLPQLGWGRVNDFRFFRDGETLDISFFHTDEGNVVRFLVRPVL